MTLAHPPESPCATRPQRDPARVARRSLLRTVAWSTPVVAATVAAPAMAASTAPAKLQFNNLTVYGGDYNGSKPTALVVQTSVQHVYDAVSSTPSSITLEVSFPTNRVGNAAPTGVSGSGWSFTGVSTSGGQRRFTFAYLLPVAAGASTSPLQFQVAMTNTSSGAVAVGASASGPNTTTATASASYSVP